RLLGRLDCEDIGALGPVAVDGQDPPRHPIHAGAERAEADADETTVSLVDPPVALVYPLPGRIGDLDRAEGGLDVSVEDDSYFGGGRSQGRVALRVEPLRERVR